MNEQQANQLFEQAIGALQASQPADAERMLKKLDNVIPSNPGIIYYLGVAASLQGRKQQAISLYDRVIRLHPQFVEAYNNKGLDLNYLGRHQEATELFRKAILIRPDFVEAYLNLGVSLNDLRLYEEAVPFFIKALELRPNFSDALTNWGGSLVELRRYQDAKHILEKAIEINATDAKAYQNFGRLYSDTKRHLESIDSFVKALEIDSNSEWILGDLTHERMKICEWSGLSTLAAQLKEAINKKKKATTPFPLLQLQTSLAEQKMATEIYISSKHPEVQRPSPLVRNSSIIRVGYVSCDLGDHPVTFLISGLIKTHNHDHFEIHGFDIGKLDQSSTRDRIVNAFDKYHDLTAMSDPHAADLIRSLKIDILVDLTGHTKGAQTSIFANRPAPIQINYLGFPGTMGASYIDYIIGDTTLIPESYQYGYTEKIAYLPDCFQANDSQREIAPPKSRSDFGIEEGAFVFGCFNQCVKFTPDVFSVWLSILKQVPNAVLWLIEDNDLQVENLRKYAEQNGVSPDRLIFTGKLPYAEHLARYALMDLALDTMPFNGGTTTSDALWGGTPVLTCVGETFAGRMTASLLTAIDLPELITQSLEEYEALAVELGTNPDKLAAIRQKLANNRLTTPLFDTERFTRHIENAYEQMVARHQKGLAPDHIYVSAT